MLLNILSSEVCELKQYFYFSSSHCSSFVYFSSKQEPGLNLYLSKYQDLSSGCRLHITCVIACLHEREMEKQWEVISSITAILLLLVSSFPYFMSSCKGEVWEQVFSRSRAAMESRNTRNKTKALESYKQHAVSMDFHPLGMIILTAAKRAVHIPIWDPVAGIMPLPPQRADGEAVPFSEVCGDKEKTCTRHVSGSQPILLPAW